MGIESEQIAVEIEGFEGRRHGDDPGGFVEDLADESGRVEAADPKADRSVGRPPCEVDEFGAAEGEDPVEVGQGEEEIEDRVVGDPQFLFALVEEVGQHRAVEGDPEIRDRRGIERGKGLVPAVLLKGKIDRRSDVFGELANQRREVLEDRVGTGGEVLERSIDLAR